MNGWRIIEGDALECLMSLPSESVDAVVTDPPFGIGFSFGGVKETASNPEEYWAWLKPIYLEFSRCLKPGGFCAIWQSQLYFRYFWEWFGPDIHIYCAAKNFVQMRPTPINYGYDPVVMFYKPGGDAMCPPKSEKAPRNVDFFVANTAGLASKKERIEREHECPKPIDLMMEVLRNFALPGGIVLDPFAGSGSTGVAAQALGMEFIGIEKHPPYVDLIKRRLSGANKRHTQQSFDLLEDDEALAEVA